MAPKNKTSEPSEADIIFTRASVALAKSQRLIASWLSPPTPRIGPGDGDVEENKEEEEDWKVEAGSELLGIGATPPTQSTTSILRKGKDPTLDALRKQLLGRHAPKPALSRPTAVPPMRKATPARQDEGDSDDEGGRGGIFGPSSREAAVGKKKTVIGSEAPEEGDGMAGEEDPQPKKRKRKATSYLDEILAEKQAKQNKKKKNKGNAVGLGGGGS